MTNSSAFVTYFKLSNSGQEMGIFSFIKEAGAKVFGLGKSKAEDAAEGTEQNKRLKREENEKAARKLEERIRELKLEVEDLRINIEEDMAVVSGLALDQPTREKIVLVVGNTEGISQVDDRMDVENCEPEAVFHTVETGDSLEKISEAHYHDASKYMIIFEANKPMLKDPKKIYPGQVLRIPPLEEEKSETV